MFKFCECEVKTEQNPNVKHPLLSQGTETSTQYRKIGYTILSRNRLARNNL